MMRLSGLNIRVKTQKGFSLTELLIAIAITSIISGVLATLVIQILATEAASSNQMDAVKQVERALHYLNRDIQMASPLQTQLPATGAFPLTLKWTDYLDNSMEHVVTYNISDGNLQRSETVAGTEQAVRIIADHIDPANTMYTYNGALVTIYLTASVDGYKLVTKTRIFEVKLRPSS